MELSPWETRQKFMIRWQDLLDFDRYGVPETDDLVKEIALSQTGYQPTDDQAVAPFRDQLYHSVLCKIAQQRHEEKCQVFCKHHKEIEMKNRQIQEERKRQEIEIQKTKDIEIQKKREEIEIQKRKDYCRKFWFFTSIYLILQMVI